jgi:hypothetical protein
VPRSFESDRTWVFPLPAGDLWARLSAVEEYRRWWPWLRRFRPRGGFATDSRWDCVVSPPLPYVIRFTVVLEQVEAPGRVLATVHGGVRGSAELTVAEQPGGESTARLRSRLAPADPVLRRISAVAPSVAQWGHDWVLEQGRRQFMERALEARHGR